MARAYEVRAIRLPPGYTALKRYRETGCRRSLDSFVRANLPLAKSFAAQRAPVSAIPFEELFAAALRAVGAAALSFDPSRASFSHHAFWAFRAQLTTLRKQARPGEVSLDNFDDRQAELTAPSESLQTALRGIIEACKAAHIPERGIAMICDLADADHAERNAVYLRHGIAQKVALAWLAKLRKAL